MMLYLWMTCGITLNGFLIRQLHMEDQERHCARQLRRYAHYMYAMADDDSSEDEDGEGEYEDDSDDYGV